MLGKSCEKTVLLGVVCLPISPLDFMLCGDIVPSKILLSTSLRLTAMEPIAATTADAG